MPEHILVADIGGTNARFAIAQLSKGGVQITHKQVVPTRGKIDDAIKAYLATVPVPIHRACFAVAGVISKDRRTCKLSNATWHIDTRALARHKLKTILLNDFEAIGYAVNALPLNKMLYLQGRHPRQLSKIAIIGAGTGLGHAFCIRQREGFIPYPEEGGTAAFPVRTYDDIPVAAYLFKNNVPLEMESVVSGRGIVTLYAFLGGCVPDADEAAQPAIILSRYDEDEKARAAFTLFQHFYGYAARNLCVYTLPDLLLIAGGIAFKNKKHFGKPFLSVFGTASDPPLQAYLRALPIAMFDPDDAGLLGAAWHGLHTP